MCFQTKGNLRFLFLIALSKQKEKKKKKKGRFDKYIRLLGTIQKPAEGALDWIWIRTGSPGDSGLGTEAIGYCRRRARPHPIRPTRTVINGYLVGNRAIDCPTAQLRQQSIRLVIRYPSQLKTLNLLARGVQRTCSAWLLTFKRPGKAPPVSQKLKRSNFSLTVTLSAGPSAHFSQESQQQIDDFHLLVGDRTLGFLIPSQVCVSSLVRPHQLQIQRQLHAPNTQIDGFLAHPPSSALNLPSGNQRRPV